MTDLESMKAVICLCFFQVQKWKSHPSASEPIFLPTDRVCCCLSCLLWQRFILLALQPGNAVLGSPMECWSSGGAKGSSPACQERACPSLPHAKLQEMQTALCFPARCGADAGLYYSTTNISNCVNESSSADVGQLSLSSASHIAKVSSVQQECLQNCHFSLSAGKNSRNSCCTKSSLGYVNVFMYLVLPSL